MVHFLCFSKLTGIFPEEFKMKKFIYILILIMASIYTNGYSQGKNERARIKADTTASDSVEYELIIIDPGFQTWFQTQPPREYLTKEYYEYMNRLYVAEWNYRYTSSNNQGEYDSYIDYNPSIDYGLDLNYELYYYFKYFEKQHKTKLYPSFR